MRFTYVIVAAAAVTLTGCSASAGMTGTPSPVVPSVTQADAAPLTTTGDASDTASADAGVTVSDPSRESPSHCAGDRFLLI